MSGNSPPPVLTAQHSTRLSSSSHGAASDANIRNFAPVARIMKTALPDNAKIAKEAKECMQECVSEFISFITSEGMLPPSESTLSSSARPPANVLQTRHSLREMPAGKAKDGKWRRYPIRHDLTRLRELLGSAEDLSLQVPRSEFRLTASPFPLLVPISLSSLQRQISEHFN